MLKIAGAPASLRDVECDGWGWTDVLITCVFRIDPEDFPSLLAGKDFSERAVSGSSYDFSTGPTVGKSFPVVAEFSAIPSDFKHGGRVWMVTNAERNLALVSYYEE